MRISLIITSLYGLTGVSLGAFGAHALKDRLLENGTLEVWRTAVFYQISHAIALLVISFMLNDLPKKSLGSACVSFWAAGIFLFSGSLYLIALGGPKWLGPITPLGGVCLIVGWLLLLIMGLKYAKN